MAALHKKHFLVGCLSSLIGTFASFPALAAELTVQIGAFGDRPGPGVRRTGSRIWRTAGISR